MQRRAKQFAEVALTFKAIPVSELRICCHSDAALQNASGDHSQGGFILSFVQERITRGETSLWSPFHWKSYRMKRICGSSLAAEAHVLSDAVGQMEWATSMLAEALEPTFSLRNRAGVLGRYAAAAVIDCKSIYDHVIGKGAPTSTGDKRSSIDIVLARQALSRLGCPLRWCPTERQISDGLTKDSAEAADLLRSILREGKYTLSEESTMMEAKATERERRLTRGAARKESSDRKGPRADYWLPTDSTHYLRKLAKGLCGDREILALRVHQAPRLLTFGVGDSRTKLPLHLASEERLTIRRNWKEGTVGPVIPGWDAIGDVKSAGEQWVGATVFFKKMMIEESAPGA
jgi:hypothetical protein